MEDKPKLRFAPLIRVSSEKQKKKGESLLTQKNQIEEAVKMHGGSIPDVCWEYCGQEHATPSYERKKLDQLLKDSSKGIFDAVIVADPSRWSRDNVKNEQGLEILLENKVQFFVLTTAYDLNDPQARMYLAMNAVMNQFQARVQAKKSIENRRNRFNRGIPSCGILPHGRLYDRKTNTWDTDPVKKKNIEWAAEQFLSGKSIYFIAKTLNLHTTTTWKIFKFQCGTNWKTKLGTIQVPQLLPQEIIDAILKRIESNKTITHNPRRPKGNKYLLSSIIFCEDCGLALIGRPHPRYGYLIYQHQKAREITGKRKTLRIPSAEPSKEICPNYTRWDTKAADIDEAVMSHLFNMYGNADAIEKAIADATPDLEKMESLRKQKVQFENELKKVLQQKDRLIDLIADGQIPKHDVKIKFDEIKQREVLLVAEIENISHQTNNTMSKEEINITAKSLALLMKKWAVKGYYKTHDAYKKMTFEEKRRLLEKIFNGHDPEGRKLGVYLKKDGPGRSYIIRGIFSSTITGYLPMKESQRDELQRKFNPENNLDSSDLVKESNTNRLINNCCGS